MPALTLASTAGTETLDEQQGDKPRATFRDAVEVVEILLDVTVNDRKGNAILDLDAGDIVVRHRGEPLEITSVTLHRAGERERELLARAGESGGRSSDELGSRPW